MAKSSVTIVGEIKIHGEQKLIRLFRKVDVDCWEIYMDCLRKRVELQDIINPITIEREVRGVKVRITHKKAKSKALYVERVDD